MRLKNTFIFILRMGAIVLGLILLACFPLAAVIMSTRPNPQYHPQNHTFIPMINAISLMIWNGPGIFIAAVVSWLGVLLLGGAFLAKRLRLWLLGVLRGQCS